MTWRSVMTSRKWSEGTLDVRWLSIWAKMAWTKTQQSTKHDKEKIRSGAENLIIRAQRRRMISEQVRLSIRMFIQHIFFLPLIFNRTCGMYVAEHKTKTGIGEGLGGSGWVVDERWPSNDWCFQSGSGVCLDSSICWTSCRVVRLPLRTGTISRQSHFQRQTPYLCQHLPVNCSKEPNNIYANTCCNVGPATPKVV